MSVALKVKQVDGLETALNSKIDSIGDTIGSATAGSVLFVDTSGILAQDNSAFFWDNTNNRLGIGTSTPGYALSVDAGASSGIQVIGSGYGSALITHNSGSGKILLYNVGTGSNTVSLTANTDSYIMNNFGVGTATPGYRLDVSTNTANDGIRLVGGGYGSVQITHVSGSGKVLLYNVGTGTNTVSLIASSDSFFMNNLGIGTATPGYKLDVSTGTNNDGIRVIGNSYGSVQLTHISGSGRVQLYNVSQSVYGVDIKGEGSSFFLGNVSIGTASPATSTILDLSSNTGALLLPRMNTTQRNALTATNGMLIYNTTNNKFEGYENGAWASLI